MTPDELKLLHQLDAATSAKGTDFADSESAALGDGWCALQHALRPVATKPFSPVLVAALTARLTRQIEAAAQRRMLLRRTVWASAAVVAVVCSVIGFRLGSVPVEVAERSVEPKPEFSLPAVPEAEAVKIAVDEYPLASPVITESQSQPVWEGIDTELTELTSRVDDLRSEWRLTPSYLDYVARRFEQLEYELAVTKL